MQPGGDISIQLTMLPFLLATAAGLFATQTILNSYWKCSSTLYRCTCGHLRILHKEREFKSMTNEDFNYTECTDNSCAFHCKQYKAM